MDKSGFIHLGFFTLFYFQDERSQVLTTTGLVIAVNKPALVTS